jgi:hypothetical protein
MTSQVHVAPPSAPPSGQTAARGSVPWPTVLSLGVLLAYTDGFWTTTLREAVGSIERTSAPFSAWVRESTLLLPLFTLAVLAALTLARRRYGSVLRGRSLVAGAALVVAAATLAGVAELATSSWFDYRLQLAGLGRMGTMGGRCVGECLEGQRDATLLLQSKSVAYGCGILLASNILFVGWALAFMGGRLPVERKTGGRSRRGSRLDDLRILVAVGLAGSALVHAAVVPRRVLESPAAGVAFVALAVVQLLAADRVVNRPGPLAWKTAVVASSGPLLLAGFLGGHGLAAVAAGALEVVTLLAAVAMLRSHTRVADRHAASAHAGWVTALAVAAVAVIGLGSGLGLYGGPGAEHQLAPHKTTSPSKAVAQGER